MHPSTREHQGVVEKAMEEAFPHVQLRLDPALDELRVRIQRGAQFEAARAGNDQRWREACEGFRRVDRCNERVFRIRAFEISEATAGTPSARHDSRLAERLRGVRCITAKPCAGW